MFYKDYNRAKHIERLELTQILGASLGSISLGASGVIALTEVISDQSDRLNVGGALAIVAIASLTLATISGIKLPILKSMLNPDAQPEIQSPPNQSN